MLFSTFQYTTASLDMYCTKSQQHKVRGINILTTLLPENSNLLILCLFIPLMTVNLCRSHSLGKELFQYFFESPTKFQILKHQYFNDFGYDLTTWIHEVGESNSSNYTYVPKKLCHMFSYFCQSHMLITFEECVSCLIM